MIALALALILSQDGGTDAPVVEASGYIAVQSGMFLRERGGVLMVVDGGVWADDATVIQSALRQRVVGEQLKLAQEAQFQEILKWMGIGAGIGAVATFVLGVLIYVGSLGK